VFILEPLVKLLFCVLPNVQAVVGYYLWVHLVLSCTWILILLVKYNPWIWFSCHDSWTLFATQAIKLFFWSLHMRAMRARHIFYASPWCAIQSVSHQTALNFRVILRENSIVIEFLWLMTWTKCWNTQREFLHCDLVPTPWDVRLFVTFL